MSYTPMRRTSLATLFAYQHIIHDILRRPRVIVMEQSARILSPPQELFARNYTTTQDECVVRLSRLLSYPFLQFYVSPWGCVMLKPDTPILPADAGTWGRPTYDTFVPTENKGRTQIQSDDKVDKLLEYNVTPVSYDKINLQDNTMAVLNYSKFPDRLRVSRNGTSQSNLCMRKVALDLKLSTVDDFSLPDQNDNVEFFADGSRRAKNLVITRPANVDNYIDFLRRS